MVYVFRMSEISLSLLLLTSQWMLYTSASLPINLLSQSAFFLFLFCLSLSLLLCSQGSRLIALAARAAQLPPVPGVVYDAHQYQFLARYYETRESLAPITKRFPLRRWGFFKSYKFACDLVQQAARPGVFQEGEIMPVEDLSMSSSSSSSLASSSSSSTSGVSRIGGTQKERKTGDLFSSRKAITKCCVFLLLLGCSLRV